MTPGIEVALYRPQIPPNTGNVARLCVSAGAPLHIVGEPAFSFDDRNLRRAGLDFWDDVDLRRHEGWEAFDSDVAARGGRILLLTRHARRLYTEHDFAPGDVILFGQETSGVPPEIHEAAGARSADHLLRIPMAAPSRSLNLSNAVAVVLFEAQRQLGFPPPFVR